MDITPNAIVFSSWHEASFKKIAAHLQISESAVRLALGKAERIHGLSNLALVSMRLEMSAVKVSAPVLAKGGRHRLN
jgi:hypothetical protein